MQPLLRPRDTSILNIRFGKALPPALTGPIPVNKRSSAQIDKGSCVNVGEHDGRETTTCTHLVLVEVI